MLKAVPLRWFSNDYTVSGDDITPLLLDLSNWRESAELEIDGVAYKLARDSAFGGDFTISSAGMALARARKISFWRSGFEIQADGRTFELKRASMWRSSFSVLEAGKPVGTVSRAGTWSREAVLDLPPGWPLALRLFVFWLVVVMWRRDEAAAAT